MVCHVRHPGERDEPVVNVGEWHSAQPTMLKSVRPFVAEAENAAGAGGAESRMKLAKLTMSDDISVVVPAWPPLALRILVASSGDPLKTHPGVAERSFTKASFETPCSTL